MTREARDAADSPSRCGFLAAPIRDLRQPLRALGMFARALAGHAHDVDGRALVERITASVSALEALL